MSQKLQIQDYILRRGSAAPVSVIDRLRHKVVENSDEIDDSLLGVEMCSMDGGDDAAATSSPSDSGAAQPRTAASADAIDFYSAIRLPVDVSFMEFHPETPPR